MFHVGEIMPILIELQDTFGYIQAPIYVCMYQRIPFNELAMFLTSWLLKYSGSYIDKNYSQ